MGLKILRINQNITEAQREKAEEAVDTIGVNSRITLPPGIELEIDRSTGGFDVLPLIEHHNNQMAISALTQVISQVKYAYPYGRGTEQSRYLTMAIHAIMRQMEATLNNYAVAPLIDWNFGTKAYPKIKLQDLTDEVQMFLAHIFDQIMNRKDTRLPEGFIEEVTKKVAERMNLEWAKPEEAKKKKEEENYTALEAFEKGKIKAANFLKVPAPPTPKKIRTKLKTINLDEDHPESYYEGLGWDYVYRRHGKV